MVTVFIPGPVVPEAAWVYVGGVGEVDKKYAYPEKGAGEGTGHVSDAVVLVTLKDDEDSTREQPGATIWMSSRKSLPLFGKEYARKPK